MANSPQKLTLASRHLAEICWAGRLLWLCAAALSAHSQLLEWFCQIPVTLHNAQASQILLQSFKRQC